MINCIESDCLTVGMASAVAGDVSMDGRTPAAAVQSDQVQDVSLDGRFSENTA